MVRETFDDYNISDQNLIFNEEEAISEVETGTVFEKTLETSLSSLSLKDIMLEVLSNQTIIKDRVEDILNSQFSSGDKEDINKLIDSILISQNEQITDLGNKLSQLLSSNLKTQQNFAKLLRLQEINSNLHDELSLYKSGLFEEIKLPIFRSIWKVRKNLVDELTSYKKKKGIENEDFVAILESAIEDIDELLESNQLHIFTSEVGDVFNTISDKKYNDVYTSQKELHLTVAMVRNSGLEKGSIVIEKQVVDVYKYAETATEEK
ncbi:hypothetical protein HO483_03505 [Streptococcus suis]|uniref:hypothetical protein n=1 Tax=Streptococcus parasuis TaxID=1501662 RepID=UPI0015581815|nr:hypothetical protein [Streptococcus suis]WNF87506.1 hypothetical protein RJW51_05195 [Streptococcus parasuis]